MRKIVFPPVEMATEDGLVAVGGDLKTDTLIEAYRQGIFPWPLSLDFPVAWFSPNPRGILDFKDLHVPKSLQKFLKKSPFEIKMNKSFQEIIRLCAVVPRKDQPSTWITPEIIQGYSELFELGHAWCVGAWLGQRLVGGLYGVKLGEFRSGESMFTLEDNAGKACLLHAIEIFKSEGVQFLDTQMVTNVVESVGGKYIPRQEFLARLNQLNLGVN
ncbi:MAG: leucyl/phenylalanyl-tRNA--protein transferase [Bacteriovoracaceae bacterium]|nr:leucyl/phenylalanyl-tRNA--protein transferase [Bacteriovoracaceae bacterium]